ncbi:MAG: DUF4386 family protein [Pseudolysinimonas sp.]|uniref:DUF4386 family protein n=1 Tax=Pseudolysinimonas sp. TaxID=2680009 RepID=UPI003C7314B8
MDWTPRQASIAAALSLIGMAVLGPLAAFGVLADGPAGLAMTGVAILDIVVGVALWRVLAPTHGSLAVLAATLRIAYAAVLVVAAGRLSAGAHAEFESIWDAGLAIFGLHLVVVGGLLVSRPGFARVTGILVAVAGAGYLADAIAALLVPGTVLGVATFTFVGELVLIVWLFMRGGRPVVTRRVAAVAV